MGATGARSSSASGSPIVVGHVGTYTGGPGSLTGGKKAIQAWADEVNADGGINGHPIKLIIHDTGGTAAGGVAAVKELVEKDHVVAIVGEDDHSDANWASYAQQSGVPIVGGNPIQSLYMTNPDFYPAGGNLIGLEYGIAKEAAKLNGKVAVVYCAEAPVCKQLGDLFKAIAPSGGATMVAAVAASATAPDYTAVCQTIKDSGAGMYQLGVSGALALRIAKECKQAGVTAKPAVVGGSAAASQATESALDGLIAIDNNYPWFDSSNSAVKEFQDATAKYQPLKGDENGAIAMWSWASAKLFQKAAASVTGEITPDSIKTALYSLKGETLGGIAPPLTYTAGKPAFIGCSFSYSVSGGKWVSPANQTADCMPADLVAKFAK